ncbi:MAG: hypothetical protein WDZ83_07795 [Rhizobiaceae bacterium]
MMDWALAIKRNREALERILAGLFSLVGLAGDDPAGGPQTATLPRHLHAHVLRILRAAESAIRRLIVIAARDVTVEVRPGGKASLPGLASLRKGRKQEPAGEEGPAALRIPAFPLLDTLKKYPVDPPRRASKFMPRICVVGYSDPAPLPVKPVLSFDDPINATGLHRRLLSSRRALESLPAQARRLARWQARNKLRSGPGRVVPLRFGRPPGGRTCPPKPGGRRWKRSIHAVDDILKECHALALDVLSPPDTS